MMKVSTSLPKLTATTGRDIQVYEHLAETKLAHTRYSLMQEQRKNNDRARVCGLLQNRKMILELGVGENAHVVSIQ